MNAVWCAQCNEIFEAGLSECPFCGGALAELPQAEWSLGEGPGETLASWPEGEDGEPVREAYLKTVSAAALEDEMVCSILRAFKIPALKKRPNNGIFGKIILGAPGVVDIFVPETMLEDAKTLIEQQ